MEVKYISARLVTYTPTNVAEIVSTAKWKKMIDIIPILVGYVMTENHQLKTNR